jgi:hypothetical protein
VCAGGRLSLTSSYILMSHYNLDPKPVRWYHVLEEANVEGAPVLKSAKTHAPKRRAGVASVARTTERCHAVSGRL